MEPVNQNMAVRYDSILDGVRIAKAEINGFDVSFTCNTRLEKPRCTVKISQKDLFYPDIQYAGGRFTMSFNYLVIMDSDMPQFKQAWIETEAFCASAGPYIDRAIALVEAGKPLA